MAKPKISSDGRTITVRVPISIRKRGGRKLVLAPDGTNVTMASGRRHIDNAMVKAVARAFRWREMLETRHPLDHRRDRSGREDQCVLRGAGLADDATRAEYRGSDPEWAAAGRTAA